MHGREVPQGMTQRSTNQ